MFILNELIASKSLYRDKFIYLDEVLDMDNYVIQLDKIQDDHIMIVNCFYFGIGRYPKYRNNRAKWDKIGAITRDIIRKIDNKICLFVADCHEYTFVNGIDTLISTINNNRIDYVWSLYQENPEINYLKSHIMEDTKFICINNLIKDDIFKDYHLTKRYDIVYYGDVGRRYPLRLKLKKLLKSRHFKNLFKIKIIEYGEAKEEVLAKIINQSYLTIAT